VHPGDPHQVVAPLRPGIGLARQVERLTVGVDQGGQDVRAAAQDGHEHRPVLIRQGGDADLAVVGVGGRPAVGVGVLPPGDPGRDAGRSDGDLLQADAGRDLVVGPVELRPAGAVTRLFPQDAVVQVGGDVRLAEQVVDLQPGQGF